MKKFKDFAAVSAISLILTVVGFAAITYINKQAGAIFLVISLLIFALCFFILNKRNREIAALSDSKPCEQRRI